MKNKIIYVFFVVTALLCCFAVCAFAGYEIDKDDILELEKVESMDECLCAGDADNNGDTTASDARLILRASVNLHDIDASNFVKADVDGDGKLTAQDARYALRLSVGLEKFPEHNLVDVIVIPATCSTEGLSVRICTGCIKLYAEFTTPTTNHVGGKWETIVEANCLQEGVAQQKCLFCSAIIKETTIAKTGHSGEWEYPEGKSCLDPVTRVRTCTVCSEVETATENPPGKHDFWWETVTPNTCTENGLDIYKCRHCGLISDEIETKAHGHFPEPFVTIVEPTCTEEGLMADVCVHCEMRWNEKPIPATGHNYTNILYKVTKEPTCYSTGTADVFCLNCGDTREIVLDKTEHELLADWNRIIEPTCTKSGSETAACLYCGIVTREVAPLGHTVAKWVNVKPATCAEEGIRRGYCSVCNDDAAEEAIPKTEHTFNEKDANGDVIVHLTEGVLCKEDGRGYILCTVCGYKKTGTLKSTGRCIAGEQKTVTPASCTEDETVVSVCMYCKEEMPGTRKVNRGTKLGHDWGEWIKTKDATCAENGTKTKYCSRCDETQIEYIPSVGHTPGEWITVSEATCSTEGQCNLLCVDCNMVLDTKTTEKLSHTPGQKVISTPATATTDGICSVFCSVCNEEIESSTYTRINIESTYEIIFADNTDVSSGSTVSFTITGNPEISFVRFSYETASDTIETPITVSEGVYTFTIPADMPETATITIKAF